MHTSNQSTRARRTTWLTKAAVFLAVAVAFGWFYGWAAPRVFPTDTRAGFALGALHGALMPMALPSLALGRDVEIYAANNSGRVYKLGYIAGIDVCGLIFFGAIFWRPNCRRRGGDSLTSNSEIRNPKSEIT